MKVRTMVGALVVAPVLVLAAATPGNAAAARGTVAFAGLATYQQGTAGSFSACFSALDGCTGAAAGAIVAKAVTGMQADISYSEACVADVPVPVGQASISASFRDVSGQWAGPVNAKWLRFGTIAVITGDAGDIVGGAALVVPAHKAVPACGTPLDLAIVGAMAFV